MTTLGLGTVTNQLLSDSRFRTVVVITAATTGNPALGTLDLTRADRAVTLQYAGEGQPGGLRLEDISKQVKLSHLAGTFDVAMVDPHHTYESSLECLALALNMLRPSGVLLVHDCLPPPEYTSPTFTPGNWCGTTFAAFRDLCVANRLRWFTLGTDFGIGVAVKKGIPVERRVPGDAWTVQSHDEYLARYTTEPCAFMQVVGADDAHAALELALGDESVNQLRMPFPGWPDLRERLHESTDLTHQQLLEENHGLRERVAVLQAHLIEAGRPTWQARALLKSTPRAIRARLEPRVQRVKR